MNSERRSITLPADLNRRMSRCKGVNWSEVAANAFESALAERDALAQIGQDPDGREFEANYSDRLDYTWEKCYAMVLGLASGDWSIQKRLVGCFRGSLIRLTDQDFPLSLRKDWKVVNEELSKLARAEAEGKDPAKLMDEVQAGRLAEQVVSLYEDVVRLDERIGLSERRGK